MSATLCNVVLTAKLTCRFAQTAEQLEQVGKVLMGTTSACSPELTTWKVAFDAFNTAPDVAQAIYDALSHGFDAVQSVLGPPHEVTVAPVRQSSKHHVHCNCKQGVSMLRTSRQCMLRQRCMPVEAPGNAVWVCRCD